MPIHRTSPLLLSAPREHLYRHIVSDIKAQNRKHRNERLNRALQNFMYSMLADDNETAAKKSLAVLMELYRRGVWRDARTVNVIASGERCGGRQRWCRLLSGPSRTANAGIPRRALIGGRALLRRRAFVDVSSSSR